MSPLYPYRLTALEDQVPDCLTTEGADAVFTECNVHIRNGMGGTETKNELGNLIVGYNENDEGFDRSGSHNIVVGMDHGHSAWGGLVVGFRNRIEGAFASISGGGANTASGPYSTVSGGSFNTASGNVSSISGGNLNRTTDDALHATVSGGIQLTADDPDEHVP